MDAEEPARAPDRPGSPVVSTPVDAETTVDAAGPAVGTLVARSVDVASLLRAFSDPEAPPGARPASRHRAPRSGRGVPDRGAIRPGTIRDQARSRQIGRAHV